MSEGPKTSVNKLTDKQKKWILVFICIAIFLLTAARPFLSNPSTYRNATDYLDKKLATANMLCLGSTSASFIISLMDDDKGTPIANELAHFSSYMLLVISAIFLERYLLTTLGFIATTFILPFGCLLAIMSICTHSESKEKYKEYAFRLFVFGICVILVIPVACTCGRHIEKMNEQSIEMALQDAEKANSIVQSIPEDAKSKNFFEKIGDFFSSLWNSARDALEWVKTLLNNFLKAIAVMLVTTIGIPVLICFAFVWLIKFLTGQNFVKNALYYIDSGAPRMLHIIRRKSERTNKRLS